MNSSGGLVPMVLSRLLGIPRAQFADANRDHSPMATPLIDGPAQPIHRAGAIVRNSRSGSLHFTPALPASLPPPEGTFVTRRAPVVTAADETNFDGRPGRERRPLPKSGMPPLPLSLHGFTFSQLQEAGA